MHTLKTQLLGGGGIYRKIWQVIWENEMKLSDTASFISELLYTKWLHLIYHVII